MESNKIFPYLSPFWPENSCEDPLCQRIPIFRKTLFIVPSFGQQTDYWPPKRRETTPRCGRPDLGHLLLLFRQIRCLNGPQLHGAFDFCQKASIRNTTIEITSEKPAVNRNQLAPSKLHFWRKLLRMCSLFSLLPIERSNVAFRTT